MTAAVLISTEEAAIEMHVARSTILGWVHRGLLPIAGKINRRSYYWRDDVLKAERRARRGQDVADAS